MKKVGIIAIVIAVIFLPIVIYRQIKLSTLHTVTFTVERKGNREFKKNADGSDNQYANLIYTDKGVFNNVDSMFPWKTRSSDVYNQLFDGQTYTCEIVGWRIGYFSSYKNIVDCEGFTYQ